MRMLVLFLPLLIIVGCAHSPKPEKRDLTTVEKEEQQRRLLTGKWLGKGKRTDKNETITWLLHHKDTGEYQISFQVGDLVPKYQQETFGLWGVSSDIYFTITREITREGHVYRMNPPNSNSYNAYKILELNKETFSFQGLEDGEVLTMKKVPDDFVLKERK